jgi:coniferyl-aldehyde dehydrogenase
MNARLSLSDAETDLTDALHAALQRQRQAYLAQPVPTRAQRLADLATLERFIREQQEALIAAVSADYGHRSRHETLLTEITPALAAVRHARGQLRRWMRPQRRHVDRLAFGLMRNEVLPQPLGVVGVIVPWNFPINLSLVPLTYIFAAGNRALVKMSENSRHLARLLIDKLPTYFPPDKLQVFDESGGVGIAFSRLPFDHLLFTGSGATGRKVMAAAAENLCPVTLELGGKAPAVVCEDFPTALAAERILHIKCLNAGQICTTVDHVFVPEAQVQAFVQAAQAKVPRLYSGLDSPDYTSIIEPRAYQRLVGAMDEARARGAQLIPLLPGAALDEARHRIVPHLVLNAPADCELMRREIFGPLLPVVPYPQPRRGGGAHQCRPAAAGALPLQPRRRAHRPPDRARDVGRVVTVNDALLHVAQDDLPLRRRGRVGHGPVPRCRGLHDLLKTASDLPPVALVDPEADGAALRQAHRGDAALPVTLSSSR